MELHCMSSPSSLHPKIHRNAIISPSLARSHQRHTRICFKARIYYSCFCYQQQERNPLFLWKSYAKKKKKYFVQPREQPTEVAKKGSIAGAVALVIGTSIGSGILALPEKASPAGLFPSSISIVICWGFLLIEALVLVEINVALRRKKRMKEGEGEKELEVISITTMAQETLGDLGGTLATVTYVFLGYTSMVAYSSKSGEILFHLLNLPASISSFFFTALFTILISLGGTRATAQVNQWLTTSMIAIEVLAVVFGGWAGSAGSGDWGKIPATIPVMIFSLVYHDIAPVLCAYLGGDLTRIRTSVLLGSLVPLLALLVWDAVALGLSTEADHVDPVELLMRVQWSGVSLMVEAFSLLAVGTSLIGTLLGFSEFFKEQLYNISWQSPSKQNIKILNKVSGQRKWWGRNKATFAAMAMAVTPSLFVSTTSPDACSAAIDIAGGYCMTLLYGVLPPAMAWAMLDRNAEDTKQKAFSKARPMLLGVGLFACGIVMEQILQDIPLLAR